MKSIQLKPILFIAIVLTFILSACGARAVPTVDPAQVQASAVAAANTMVATDSGRDPHTDTSSAHGCGNRHPATYTDYSGFTHHTDSQPHPQRLLHQVAPVEIVDISQ